MEIHAWYESDQRSFCESIFFTHVLVELPIISQKALRRVETREIVEEYHESKLEHYPWLLCILPLLFS